MFRYIKMVCVCIPVLIYSYFAWILRYYHHPERYPLEVRYQKVRKLALIFFKVARVEIRVSDKSFLNMNGSYLLVGNHIGDLDPIIFLGISPRPVTFVCKKEIRSYPFLGKIISSIDGVFIDRDDVKSQIKELLKVEKSLKEGKNTWLIFPEGTRNRDSNAPLLPFHPGTFKIPMRSGAPVIPFAIFGSQRCLKLKPTYKKYIVSIKVGEAFYYDDYKDKNTQEIADFTSSLIQKEVNEIRPINNQLYVDLNK